MKNESELLSKFAADRNPAPDTGITEEPEAVNVSEEAPTEVDEVIEDVVVESTAEAIEPTEVDEEASADVETDADSDEDEGLYVEYKGREINLKDVYETEQGQLRQADYTRKTQDLAEKRKTFEAEQESHTEQQSQLADTIATLDAIIQEETLSAEDLKELREYEPEEYIKHQEKLAKRKETLATAKQLQPVDSGVDIQAESTKLWADNPTWLKDGVQTQTFTDDMSTIKTYALSIGYSEQELAGLNKAHHFKTLLDAAKGQAVGKKNASLEKKVRKAPVSTKPRAAVKTSLVSEIEKTKALLQKTGKVEYATKLQKLRRQQTG